MLTTSPRPPVNFIRRIINFLQAILRECWDLLGLTVRGSEIVLRLAPLTILTPASVLAHHYPLGMTQNHLADLAWWYFTGTMNALGPCFVKAMQWIATRRDMFPPNVCDRLAHLHDQGTRHGWHYTHSSLSESFGDYNQKGLDMHDVIGCGSAAQVYRAKLKEDENERWVAVKVLHPRMTWLVERDMWLMDTVAKLLHSLPLDFIQMANLPRAASNFGNNLRQQTDLSHEAANLHEFRQNFYGKNGRKEESSLILFPQPIQGWVSHDVMLEDLVEDATPIAEFLKDESEQGLAIRKELGSILLRAFLKMVFLDNFVHADLHPGNCLVVTKEVPADGILMGIWKSISNEWFSEEDTRSRPKTKMTRKIVFLDAGIATSLSQNDQRNLHDLFRAVILNEGYEAGRLMVERAKYERCSQVPGGIEAFSSGIESIVKEFHDNRKAGLSLGAVRIGSLLGRVLDLCRVHGVELDPSMASIVVSTLVLEGLGRSLDPNLNLIDFAIPFVLGRGQV